MRFAITGSTGLIGSHITHYLRTHAHEVTRVIRSYSDLPHGERAVVWHPDRDRIEAEGLEGHDVVIHLAGESLAGVWTAEKKRRILSSRTQGTTLIARTLAGLKEKPRALFSASGFNIYGDRPGSEMVDESSPAGAGFIADVAKAWEASTLAAQEAGIRVVHMRFGNVISGDGGLVGVLKPLFKLGLGAKLGSGRQVWPWISIQDIPPAILHVLERPEISGPVNFASPNPVTNEEFTDTFAGVLGRPSFFAVPKFATRLAPGGMADEILLSGARVEPRKLLDSGYEFLHPELRGALAAALG
jgi:uncharacterized protein (TIGR01777 family)